LDRITSKYAGDATALDSILPPSRQSRIISSVSDPFAAAKTIGDVLNSPQPATWLFAGDSITQGSIYTRGHRDYTQLFKERLFEFTRKQDVIIHTGVSGWSITDFLPRLQDRVLRFRPDAVFLLFGTNDSVSGGDGLSRFIDAYDTAIAQLRAGGISRIVLQTSPPMHPVDPESFTRLGQYADDASRDAAKGRLRNVLSSLEAYVQATRDIARRNSLPLIDHYATWIAAKGHRGQLLDGGFHPNEYGHRLLARTLFKSLNLWDEKSWTCRLFLPADVAE
jgi:acyl-CoA thioesterase I